MITKRGPCEALLCYALGEHVLQTNLNKPKNSSKAQELVATCLKKSSVVLN